MAGFVEQRFRLPQPLIWYEQLEALLAHELAPTPRKLRTALRMATIGTIGAGLIAACHVNNELGTYIVWLLVGAGPMLSLRKAGGVLIVEALALAGSVIMARAFAETPWMMLPFLFALFSFSTYVGMTYKLGAALLLIEVVCLDTFYGVVFAPQQIGWAAAGVFGGSVIAFGTILLFDNWLWPDPGEPLLREALGSSITRARGRLLQASNYYLDREGAPRPPLPPATSDLPAHMTLLTQAAAEGVSEHRLAILLAAITRIARINLEVDRLIVSARENEPREIRAMLGPEIQAAVEAIATAFEEIAHELRTHIAVGIDATPPAWRSHARSAMDNLATRILQVRPAYIGKVSSGEIENFASFTDSLEVLTRYVERQLDEPPQPGTQSNNAATRSTDTRDPALVRYCMKVGLCVVVGYLVGLISHRPELSTILTTVLITALPTYGATLRKMNLRIVGAIIGGAVSLLAIIIISPNFETLPAYMISLFIVFYVSAYSSLTSGRVAYAGKQIGTTYALAFAGLSPSIDIYGPLWRIWSILLGTVVVGVVFFLWWPEYAGDSLLPRLRKVIRDALALTPGGSASNSDEEIQKTNSETMSILAEMLQVADDAQVEGRTSMVNHHAIVEAAGTLRRIANRLSSIAAGRILIATPRLDPVTEAARERVFDAIRRQLGSWLDFFSGPECLGASAAQSVAQAQSPDDLANPLNELSSRLEEREFGRMASWTLEQRRAMLAEVYSMRRLEFLISELNRYLASIPGPAARPQ